MCCFTDARSVYTMDMSILSRLVEDARRRYINVSKPNVIVHSTEAVVVVIVLPVFIIQH